jgi:tyrosine aminotransferase
MKFSNLDIGENMSNQFNDTHQNSDHGSFSSATLKMSSTFLMSATEISNNINFVEEAKVFNYDVDTITSCYTFPASKKSLRTHNPIRALVDPILATNKLNDKVDKKESENEHISLALGDPTINGNLRPCPAIIETISNVLQESGNAGGYINACGTEESRLAISKFHCCEGMNVEVTPNNVIVANGCSGALELALTALLDEDSVLLVPRPSFPLYEVIAKSHGARVMHYNLLPDKEWECDLVHLETVIIQAENRRVKKYNYDSLSWDSPHKRKKVVRGVVINNPGNPTGSVFSYQHLCDLLDLAYKYEIPIVSDEIYGELTYGNSKFIPLIEVVSKERKDTAVIVASGIGKQYMLPGWRVGWVTFYDRGTGCLKEVQAGAQRLAQVILGASHLVQHAVPVALGYSSSEKKEIVQNWKKNVIEQLEHQAFFVANKLKGCHGLSVITPQGAMYIMVRIHIDQFSVSIRDDMSFTRLLLQEENVFVLPGRAFGLDKKNEQFIRMVFCAPEERLNLAIQRIRVFCERHKA